MKVPDIDGVIAINASQFDNLALKSNGQVWGWGWNQDGLIGSSRQGVKKPVQISGLHSIISLGGTGNEFFAMDAAGRTFGWGANSFGAAGVGSNKFALSTPTRITGLRITGVRSIAAGSFHSTAVRGDGRVLCWGMNHLGQSGSGAPSNIHAPKAIAGIAGAKQVVASQNGSAVLKSDGTVWFWGADLDARAPYVTRSNGVEKAVGLEGIIEIAMGGGYLLALKDDGTLWAYGNIHTVEEGEIPRDTTKNPKIQIVAAGMGRLRSIATGQPDVYLDGKGELWMFGGPPVNEPWSGGFAGSDRPVKVSGQNGPFKAVEAGYSHALALHADGRIWGWGSNFDGQLGSSTAKKYDRPTRITSLGSTRFRSLSAASRISTGVDAGGKLWVWGYNNYGNFGNGSWASSSTPSQVPNVANVLAVSAGAGETMILRSDNGVCVAGFNRDGGVGVRAAGTSTNRFWCHRF